jgi:hypothetical protein
VGSAVARVAEARVVSDAEREAIRERAREAMRRFVESYRDPDGSYRSWVTPSERRANPDLAPWYAASRAEQAELVGVCLEGAFAALAQQREPSPNIWTSADPYTGLRDMYLVPLGDLLKRDLPFTERQFALLAQMWERDMRGGISNRRLLQVFERAARDTGLSDEVRASLARVRERIAAWKYRLAQSAELCRRLDELLGRSANTLTSVPVHAAPERPLDHPKRVWRRLDEVCCVARRAIVHGRRYDLDPWFPTKAVLAYELSDRVRVLVMGCSSLFEDGVSLAELMCPGAARDNALSLAPEFCRFIDDLFESVVSASDVDLTHVIFEQERELWQRGAAWEGGIYVLAEAMYVAGRAGPRFLAAIRARFARENVGAEFGRKLEAVEERCRPPSETVVRPGDAWSNDAIAMLSHEPEARRAAWLALLAHAAASDWSRPPMRWRDLATALVKPLGEDVARTVVRWVRMIGRPGTREQNIYGWPPDPTILMECNSRVLKGLIWAATLRPTPDLAPALADAAVVCEQRIPGLGPRNKLLRNACLAALATLPAGEAAPQLSRARYLVKYKGSKVAGDRAVARTAAAVGVSPAELVESSVPTYGLDGRGGVEVPIGDGAARIDIVGAAATRIRWRAGRGPWRKKPPDALVESDAEAVARAEQTSREIATMLAAHRLRLERLLALDRSWPLPTWRERYGDHPLLRHLCRALIWTLETRDGPCAAMWNGRTWRDHRDRPVRPTRDAVVRPWHPVEAAPAEVLAWRIYLEQAGIRQPFKQAHREVYVLTDAERTTEVYSNRFAAHILRAGQFVALMRERGWEGNPNLAFDTAVDPFLVLEEHSLRAEYRTEPIDDENVVNDRYPLVATDFVRFKWLGSGQAVRLADVPPRVFSEVMRDVDLFVSVASVGNNPEWQDGGPDGLYRTYWWSYGFGELAESGRSRRDVLERLLPRLRIAEVCELQERFLRVQGKLRAYRIHLGSGNILMEPNDEYLCIVPETRAELAGERVFLPFEGDRTLAIILSKAFMLAEDDKITDPSITRQIGRER